MVGGTDSAGHTLEERVDALTAQVERLRQRLDELEARPARLVVPTRALPQPPAASAAAAEGGVRIDTAASLPILGRTLILLGGAYLLRALTDGHLVTPVSGTALGLAYAAALLLGAQRDGARGRRLSASFLGGTALAVGLPLLVEAATRLQAMRPGLAALFLCAFALVGLAVALRHGLRSLAWFATLGPLVTALVLARLTGALAPFVGAMALVAAALEAQSLRERDPERLAKLGALRWPTALLLDLALVQVALLAAREGGLPEGYAPVAPVAVVLAELALVVLYVAAIGGQAVLRHRVVGAFEIVQGPLAVIVGLWGAERVAVAHAGGAAWIGPLAVALAVGCYWTALSRSAGGEGERNFRYYATMGGLLVLAGAWALLDGPALGVALSLLALVAMAMGTREATGTMTLHAALLAAVGAATSGLLGVAADALTASAAGPWRAAGPAVIVAALATLACHAAVIANRDAPGQRRWEPLAPTLLGALAAVVAATAVVLVLAPLVAHAPGAAADAGVLATLRTALIAGLAVAAAALAAGSPRLAELRWFVGPLLAAGGLKLLVEDLRHGRPATQFLTLALYGAALILAPRLARSGRQRSASADRPLEAPDRAAGGQ